jgi:hypothetical protein
LKGADIVKSKEIARDKMFIIHNTLGEDSKIFESDETPTAAKLFTRIMQNPETGQEESFQTKIRQKYYEIKKQHPDVINRISMLPTRIKTAKSYNQNNLLVFLRKGLGFFTKGILDTTKGVENLSLEEAYKYIECQKTDKTLKLSQDFWQNYENIKNFKESVRGSSTDQSIEQRAINNLNYILNSHVKGFEQFYPFLRVLQEDALVYKTLTLYTLRRIANLKTTDSTEKDLKHSTEELASLQKQLGIDYLDIIKERIKGLTSEVIIAIENIKDKQ